MRKGVGFHCCSLDIAASQPVNNVFGSILAQMASINPDIIEFIQPLRKGGTQLIPHNNLSVPQIQKAIKFGLEKFDRFYILIDALNESPFESLLVDTLLSLCEQNQNLRVLVTCTREPSDDLLPIHVRRMSNAAVDVDIEFYVQQRLQTEHSFRSLTKASQEEVKSRLVSGSHGV
jgi:hypothetical protein